MTVQARFYVSSITLNAHPTANVVLTAVSRGEENKTWASATPTGKIEMAVSNPAAVEWFQERLAKDVAIIFEDRDPDELTV